MNIYFFCPDAARYQSLDIDGLSMVAGKVVWSVLSARYLQQYAPHLNVQVAEEAPDEGVIVFHASYRKELLKSLKNFKNKRLVCIIADSNMDRIYADFHLYQNPTQLVRGDDNYIPFWPQPGIIPRDASRGSHISSIEFKGAAQNLAEDFAGQTFIDALVPLEAKFVISSVNNTPDASLMWRDFSRTDLQLAVRPDRPQGWDNKPPSKLINGWLAEVPSLLGPESAYQYHRKSELDYIEVSSVADVVDAVSRLKSNPNLYLDMVANGKERAKDFTEAKVVDMWADALTMIQSLDQSFGQKLVNALPKLLAYQCKKLL